MTQSQMRHGTPDLSGPPPLEVDDTVMHEPINQPRPSISFTIKPLSRPSKRTIDLTEDDIDLKEIVSRSKQRRIDPVVTQSTPQPFPLRRPSSLHLSQHQSDSSSQKPRDIPQPVVESASRANRILFGGDLSEPLCATDLRIFLHDNERAKMAVHYQRIWDRRKLKPPPPQPFSAGLLEQCIQLNITTPVPISRDRHGKDINGVTRYRGGSGIDMLMKTDSANTPSPYQISLFISLFQHGLSINNDQKNWHPYDTTSISMLRSVERGEIPPFFSAFSHTFPFYFYDGCIIAEIRDYRCITFNPIGFYPGSTSVPRDPKITRLVLRPTAESLMYDVRQIMHENHLDDEPDSIHAAAIIENEILKATRADLCLTPTPRVFQILNIAHYGRSIARARPCTKEESKQRIHELYELMRDTMFGVDVPVISPDGSIISLTSVQQQALMQAAQLAVKSRLSTFLQRQPSIRSAIKQLLIAKLESDSAAKAIKKEEVGDNDFDKMAIMASPQPQARSAIRVNTEEMLQALSDPEAALETYNRPMSAHWNPLLAYASFIHYTEQSRHLAASNLLIQDPLSRRSYTSGPYSQERRAEAAFKEKTIHYENALKAGQTVDPPQKIRALTILNHGDSKPADKARVSQKLAEQWIVYKFVQPPQQPPTTSKSKLLMIELHVHAIGLRAIPSSQVRQTAQHDMASGRYEAYLRISAPQSHEATPPTICCSLGTEADMKQFVDRFVRMAMREGRQVMGQPESSSKPTIVVYDEHSFLAELEAKQSRWTQWDEERKAAQRAMAAQQQQAQLANAQQAGGQQARRTTAGKTTGKTLPHINGPIPHSTLGLPPGASQSYGGSHPAVSSQTSRMPAGFYNARAPPQSVVASTSPAPTQVQHTMPQSPRAVPTVAPGQQMMYQSSSVPPQHPRDQHNLTRTSSGAMQHPNQPMYPQNMSVSPQPPQHTLTPEQQQRLHHQRTMQRAPYQQQQQPMRQPAPNSGLQPVGYNSNQQAQPQMTQQQYAEYQRMQQQQMAQRRH